MAQKFAYYILVAPLTLLPLWALYLISDLFYLILRTVFPYRKKVVESNLKRAFPNYSDEERNKIKKQFYRHFANLLAESIKNLSIRKIHLKKRLHIENRDLVDQLYIQGKSVIIVGAHYGNWEWVISSLNFLFAHQAIGIGTPMTNQFFDKKINQRRGRFGMKIVHAQNFKEEVERSITHPISLLILSDQSPPKTEKSYWMEFLGNPTACYFGAEMIAHEHNMAVVFLKQKMVKRGYYNMSFELISSEPRSCDWGVITESHVQALEKEIIANPAYWLWSHKRWKRDLPTNMDELKTEQKRKFYAKFPR
jgi:Kdo2-lipid IVA lauroyltransferase/acyltransferase